MNSRPLSKVSIVEAGTLVALASAIGSLRLQKKALRSCEARSDA